MSLILDALNRSRQDVGDVPGLESQHQIPQDSSATNHRWWVLALVVALAVIAFLLYERGGQSTPVAHSPEPVTEPEQAPVAPATPPVEPNIQTASAPGPAVPAAPPAVREMPVPTEKAPAKPATAAEVAALYAKKPAVARAQTVPEPRPKQVEKPASPAPVARESVSEQPLDIEALVSQAADELENAELEEHPAPFLASLSQQSKDSIPTIFYERHDYSGKPGQSAVVLNGKTLKAGGRTSTGVKVDEILPGSVVLTYQGTQFRLRALNSWVNL